jgi:hypothetical protein
MSWLNGGIQERKKRRIIMEKEKIEPKDTKDFFDLIKDYRDKLDKNIEIPGEALKDLMVYLGCEVWRQKIVKIKKIMITRTKSFGLVNSFGLYEIDRIESRLKSKKYYKTRDERSQIRVYKRCFGRYFITEATKITKAVKCSNWYNLSIGDIRVEYNYKEKISIPKILFNRDYNIYDDIPIGQFLDEIQKHVEDNLANYYLDLSAKEKIEKIWDLLKKDEN